MANFDYSTYLRDNPELRDQVLASYGGTPSAAAPPPPPAAQAPPPVEQQPAEPPASSEPSGTPIDMRVVADVERPKGSLGQQQQALMGERIQARNETGESFQREGDAKADAAMRAAQVYGEQAQKADRYAQAAEARYNSDQERLDKYKGLVDEDFERLRKEPTKPGAMKNAFNIITGIIGAAAGGNQADAIGMLRNFVNRSAEEDAQERFRAQQRIETASKIHDSILRDSTDALDASAKLVANQWLGASRQLEQIASESNVPIFREQALRLSIEAKDQARGILAQNVDAQIQERRAQAAARAAAMRPRWENMTQQELEALQKANVLPVAGAEVLAKLQKQQREAGGPAAAAVPAKGQVVMPGRQVVDPEAFKAVREVDLSKLRDAQSGMKALNKTLDALDKLLVEHGTQAFGENSATMEALAASAIGTIKDVKTLGTLDNGLLTFGEKLLGDPTSWYKTGSSVRARIKATREALNEELEAKAEDMGLSRRQETTVEDQKTAFSFVDDAAGGGGT